MTLRRLLLVLFVLCSILDSRVGQAQTDKRAVVYIEATVPGSTTPRIGTGFYVGANGRIVTAYHVIRGATRLRVYSANGTTLDSRTQNVFVDAYAPAYDLAVLRSSQGSPATLELHPEPHTIRTNNVVSIHGHPQGIAYQQTSGQPTHDGLLDSTRVNGKDGKRAFNTQIDLLSLDITTGAGMSGGPVIWDGKVVGVLCASLEAGLVRTFTFAIPATYVDLNDAAFVHVNASPERIRNWDRLTLIDEATIYARASQKSTGLQEPYYHLYVSGPTEVGWKKVGSFQTEAEAELAALQYKQANHSTHVSKVVNGRHTPPPIKRSNRE